MPPPLVADIVLQQVQRGEGGVGLECPGQCRRPLVADIVLQQVQRGEGGVGLECPGQCRRPLVADIVLSELQRGRAVLVLSAPASAAAPSWPILLFHRFSRRPSSGSVHLSPVHHDELIRTSAILQYVLPNVVVKSEEVSSAVMIRRPSWVSGS